MEVRTPINPLEGLKPAHVPDRLARWIAVRTPINPLEGLKLAPGNLADGNRRVRTPINPLEGLKQAFEGLRFRGARSENTDQPA